MAFIPRGIPKSYAVIATLVIALAIPLTVFLSQERQDLQQRAAEIPVPTLPDGCYYKPIACAPESTCEPIVVCAATDLNQNGEPDLPDFNKVVECINTGTCPPTVDLNGDGRTDEIDLNTLLRDMNSEQL